MTVHVTVIDLTDLFLYAFYMLKINKMLLKKKCVISRTVISPPRFFLSWITDQLVPMLWKLEKWKMQCPMPMFWNHTGPLIHNQSLCCPEKGKFNVLEGEFRSERIGFLSRIPLHSDLRCAEHCTFNLHGYCAFAAIEIAANTQYLSG